MWQDGNHHEAEQTATVTVTITLHPDGQASSQSKLDGIGSVQAGVILIDVGRDLLMGAIVKHLQHYHD